MKRFFYVSRAASEITFYSLLVFLFVEFVNDRLDYLFSEFGSLLSLALLALTVVMLGSRVGLNIQSATENAQRIVEKLSSERSGLKEQEQKLEINHPFLPAFQNQLQQLANRSQVLVNQAQSRADSLYRFATALTVVSCFVPLIAILVYLASDPLPKQLFDALDQLMKSNNGALPAGIAVNVSKDWRILLSGVSFGLLFLAAASALSAQFRKQSEVVQKLGQDVEYYESVQRAMNLLIHAETVEMSQTMKSTAGLIVQELIIRRSDDTTPESAPAVTANQVQELLATLKHVKN